MFSKGEKEKESETLPFIYYEANLFYEKTEWNFIIEGYINRRILLLIHFFQHTNVD